MSEYCLHGTWKKLGSILPIQQNIAVKVIMRLEFMSQLVGSQRLIVVHAGGKSGFLDKALLIYTAASTSCD